jgi:hypothetical protein
LKTSVAEEAGAILGIQISEEIGHTGMATSYCGPVIINSHAAVTLPLMR